LLCELFHPLDIRAKVDARSSHGVKARVYFFSAPGAVLPAPTLSISGSIFSEVARVWPVTPRTAH
jgi:hypothetical protein